MALTVTPAELVATAEASGSPGLLGRHESWERVPLSAVAEVLNGSPFKSDQFNNEGRGVPLVRIRDVGRDLTQTWYEGEFDSAYLIGAGDILVGMDGDFRVAAWHGPKALLNQRVCKISVRNPDFYDERFLALCLQGYLDAIAAATSSVTVKHLSSRSIENIPLPLPPIAEQHRIVEALEQQLSRLEVALKSLASSAVRNVSLQSSLVIRAFSGALLPGDDGVCVPARSLLERIDAQVFARAAKKRWSQVRDPAQEWCHDLPDGWVWRTLGSLSLLIQYGTSAKADVSGADGAVPVIRMGNIQSGNIVLDDVKYLPGDHPDVEPMRLRDGDLLFNRTNSAELVGKSAVYRDGLGEAVFASYLIRCHLADGINPDWVSAYVNSPGGRKYIRSVLSQQVGQANVNSSKLAMFPIPVPPAEEQASIMENLREWGRLLERSDQGREAAKLRAARLRESLLRAAFSGTLTQQSPDDEPAADLLARIAAERVTRAKPKRTRKVPHRRTPRPSAVAMHPAPEATSIPTPTPALAVQQEFDL